MRESPSSRRAWIEIGIRWCCYVCCWSPSSRRAWIEIRMVKTTRNNGKVALLAEGVDRNRMAQRKSVC